jgi:hypothetical protein
MNHRPLRESILQREARMEGTQNAEMDRSPRAPLLQPQNGG